MPTALDTTVALISLAEAKEYLAISTSNQDLILNHLINGVSRWVSAFLRRALISKQWTEYYSGDGCKSMQLRNYPVTAVSSIKIDSLREFGAETLVDSGDYIIKKNSGVITAFDLLGNFTEGESNIQVVYTAGYTVGADAGAGTMPYDIRLAVKRILDHQYRTGYTNRKMDMQSESIGGMNITFREAGIPKDALSMLTQYRSVMPCSGFEYAD